MKVRLLVECETPNPRFNPSEPQDDDNPVNIPILAGTEIEGPQAWLLCLPEFGDTVCRAEPIDDECKRIVNHERNRMKNRQAAEALALAKEEALVATAQAETEAETL